MAIHRYRTPYGVVRHSDTCKDDFKNMKTVVRLRAGTRKEVPYTRMTLQEPAILSIRAVEKKLSKPWRKFYVRVTGSNRSCAYQAALYATDKDRYAHPDKTLHTQGLAIDVHTGYLSEKLRKALLEEGWNQSRPVDEPWHFSYKLTA